MSSTVARRWLVVAIVAAALWLVLGVLVFNKGTRDVCSREIISRAPTGLWIAMLGAALSTAVGSTTVVALRTTNRVGSWFVVSVIWLGVLLSTGWYVGWAVIGLPSRCMYGRPRRDESGSIEVPRTDHRLRSVRLGHRAVSLHWLRIAQGEHASIAAFDDLAAQLVEHDAPGDLIERCHDAAQQERNHAALASDLVERFSGSRPRFSGDHHAVRDIGLRQLAVESWIDGCLNEGAAAAEAGFRRATVADSQIALVLATIECDEAEHAELAWAIIEWALARDPMGVSYALRSAMAQPVSARRGIRRPITISARAAAQHGWIDPALCRAVHPQLLVAARERLETLLSTIAEPEGVHAGNRRDGARHLSRCSG